MGDTDVAPREEEKGDQVLKALRVAVLWFPMGFSLFFVGYIITR